MSNHSKRKPSIETLIQSEERFRLMVDGVRDYAIFMLDTNGYVQTWNAGAEKIKRYKAEEIIGKHFSILYPPEDLKAGKPQNELQIAIREGRYEEEGWRVRKDGTRFWANVVITALRDEHGLLKGFGKVTRDMTEQRRFLEEIRQSEKRHRSLIESVKDYAIFMLDIEGRVLSWNPGAERIKGYRAEEIIGRHFSRFYPTEDIENKKPEHELEIARRNGRFEEEGWRLRKDGTRFWANVVISAIRGDHGELEGFTKVTRDMTERRQEMEKLRHSEQQFRLLVSNVKDYAIFLLSPEGHIVSWNMGAERIKGWKAEEIIGKHFSTFYPAKDVAEGKPQMELQVASREERYEEEGWRMRKDGTQFWANVIISTIRDESGIILGFSKVTRDLTKAKRAEEVLRAQAEMLASSNSQLADFAFGISHDLQEPLRMIRNYAQLVEHQLKGKFNEEVDNSLRVIQSSAARLQNQISDVLTYSQVGKSEEIIPISFEDVLSRTLLNLETSIKGSQVRITHDPLPVLKADSSQMGRVFQNIISNAIKFRRDQPVEIHISANDRISEVLFSIRDNGMGFDDQHAAQIFGMFKRLHRDDKFPGTGMGLTISKKIVESYGGSIWAESEVGKGSTFFFTVKTGQVGPIRPDFRPAAQR